ncbi:MAG: FitA-like ribbon-helix-helix domain-containing protein [Acidimicrobiales bacterium]
MGKTIQVRDVPDEVHRRLTIRARAERRSLSELIRSEIVEMARHPPMSEMLDRLGRRPVIEVPESSAEALAGERSPTNRR